MLLLVALAGCATLPPGSSPASSSPPSLPLGAAEAIERIYAPGPDAVRGDEMPRDDNATTLALEQVLAIAQRRNPAFDVFAANREAARAEVLQALAYPNPELEITGGAATAREAPRDSALEYGVGLVQPIELGAKRRARQAAAEALLPVAQREEDVFRATLRGDVAKAYHTVLYHERALELARAALRTEREIGQIVARRVEGGEAPEIDQVKQQVEMLKASGAVRSRERQLASARAVLNALCGRALPPGFRLQDALENPLAAPDLEQARQIAQGRHPALRRLEAVLRQKERIVERERKAWYPDLKPGVNAGREMDADSVGVSLGVELPLWNRNQGRIAAAEADLAEARADLERARLEVLTGLDTAALACESAREQLSAFRGGLRSAAAEALRIETFLYQEGEVDFLHLQDARRTARQTEVEYLQALYDAQIARAEFERAVGIGGEE
jgi:cobalt-zinc-cadmium efflux system outer membrane protein